MLFIGPNDLSASINKLAEFDDPEVKAQFEEARDKIIASPAFLGCISKGTVETNQLFADGFDFLLCAGDVGLLASAANDLLATLKK